MAEDRSRLRHVTLIHVRNEFGAIDAPGIDSGGPEEALADTMHQWLLAAGLPGIDARDVVSCS